MSRYAYDDDDQRGTNERPDETVVYLQPTSTHSDHTHTYTRCLTTTHTARRHQGHTRSLTTTTEQ